MCGVGVHFWVLTTLLALLWLWWVGLASLSITLHKEQSVSAWSANTRMIKLELAQRHWDTKFFWREVGLPVRVYPIPSAIYKSTLPWRARCRVSASWQGDVPNNHPPRIRYRHPPSGRKSCTMSYRCSVVASMTIAPWQDQTSATWLDRTSCNTMHLIRYTTMPHGITT